ncbi:hypothetical protein ACHQM5_012427 [Ranunculus cassubicifolius]
MEADLPPSPQPGYPIDNQDAKYISGLSTMMVATIQEMKDRISQIEYIFCGQLYPNFQSQPKKLQKRFAETMRAAEDSWKKKEIQYLHQINELEFEKKNALEENQKLEEKQKVLEESQNAEAMKATEEVWRKKEADFLNQIHELELGMKKSLQENQKLVALIEEKTKSMSAAKDDWKWRENFLQSEIESLRNQKQKTLEENQTLVASLRKEKTKIDNLQSSQELAELQSQLTQKAEEVTAAVQLQENLSQQIELKDLEITTEKKKRKELVDSYKKLKSQYNFLCKKFGLNTENSLPNSRMEEESFTSRRSPSPKTTQGLMDGNQQPSWVSVVDDLMKVDTSLEKENKILTSLSDRKHPSTSKPTPNPNVTQGPTDGNQHTNGFASMMNELKKVNTLPEKQNSDTKSPTSSAPSYRRLKLPVTAKPESLSGTKRSVPYWRETRTDQEAGGDFLDTPLEIVKEKLSKSSKKEAHDFPVPPPKDMDFSSSDDETQDLMNMDLAQPGPQPIPQKPQISITKPGDKSFKYVEPVRKKSDRDNLKGFECKQCKKFYDAVLPEDCKDGENGNSNFRCEHHDGVSRHRYKYVPPMTPEGFWNIGFESEM